MQSHFLLETSACLAQLCHDPNSMEERTNRTTCRASAQLLRKLAASPGTVEADINPLPAAEALVSTLNGLLP